MNMNRAVRALAASHNDTAPCAMVHLRTPRVASMRRWCAASVVVLAGVLSLSAGLRAQETTDLGGTWILNREASEFPRQLGFGAPFVPVQDDGSSGGRRGGRRGGGGQDTGLSPALRPKGESYDEGRRRELLTDEVITPPSRLTVVDTADAVTFTDEKGQSRSFHPNGRAETLQIDSVPVLATARRENGKLIVLYAVADLRQLRYTYARNPESRHLEIGVEFLERGTGDTVHRVYTPPGPPPAAATAVASSNGAGGDRAGSPASTSPAVPRAGSEFTGLSRIGIVVEELSSQSAGCGLKRDDLETAVAKPFTDAGLKTVRNGDEDTYLYVNVMTSTMSNGMCISRWDWSINSTTEATLSYQKRSLLAQVLLARKGGLSGSMPPTHGADVVRGMTDGLTQIASMIRDANK